MQGSRSVCIFFVFLVLISGFFVAAVCADHITDSTEHVLLPDQADESINKSENDTLCEMEFPLAAEPLIAETTQADETVLQLSDENAIPAHAESSKPASDPPEEMSEPMGAADNYGKEEQGFNARPPRKAADALSQSACLPPINPAFMAYQNRMKQSMDQEPAVKEAATIIFNDGSSSRIFLEGGIPSPIDFSYTRGHQVSRDSGSLDGTTFPGSYDLRTYGRVSPVKNQGVAGSCWAHATIASLESTLLPGEEWDFSENHMKNTLNSSHADGFDRESIGGGNWWISAAYLTRWSGPVQESADPYQALGNASPTVLPVQKHVQDVFALPERSGPTDNDNIKDMLMNKGGVQASIYWSGSYYNSTSYAFYNSAVESDTNHAITIVGWDDSFSRTNFKTHAPGDGAFIVKNSWGTGWGDGGYFYVSYYDLTIGDKCVVFTGEPVTHYNRVYSYDPLGWVDSFGYGTPSAQYANVFTARSDETLNAVGVYTTSPGSFTARIYLDPSGGPVNSSGYVAERSWTTSLQGFQTVDVPDVVLRQGQQYSIVILATSTGYTYPVPIEIPYPDYSSHAIANAGESYVSQTGVSWSDITAIITDTNVCLKGFTTINSKVGVFRNSTHRFILKNGTAKTVVNWGLSTDTPVTGDWNGDGLSDVGVYRPSINKFILQNGTESTVVAWGLNADTPVTGDWNGDGLSDVGVYRPSINKFILQNGTESTVVAWGLSADTPVTGDWNGDGLSDVGVYRPSINKFILQNGTERTVVAWGLSADTPVTGDWNGDGLSDVGVYRPSINKFIIKDGTEKRVVAWGLGTDIPVTGKWS